MKLSTAAIDKIANMICGNEPYNEIFPYRSSSSLTTFFQEIDSKYVHDGSTRQWWVCNILAELNIQQAISDELPSAKLVRVIEYLVDPDHFESSSSQNKAIKTLNDTLRKYTLMIERNATTGKVQLLSVDENYLLESDADKIEEDDNVISPKIFSLPDKEPDPGLVSVMMPFAMEFDSVYESIKLACKDADLHCYRADDIWEESTFMQDIFNLIYESSIVVVDFTGKNPNVMYETGISHTLGKNVVPLTQNPGDIPSDLKSHRFLVYLRNKEGLKELRTNLTVRLKTLSNKINKNK